MNILNKIKIKKFILKENFLFDFFKFLNKKNNLEKSIKIIHYFTNYKIIKNNLKTFLNYFSKRIINIKKKYFLCINGTGGDKLSLFNITTSSFIIIKLLGIKCLKTGSVAFTSKSGSIDFINKIFNKIKKIRKKLSIFMLIDFLNEYKKFKNLVKIRKRIKKKTIFNYIFPLLIPAYFKHLIIGTNSKISNKIIFKVLKNNYKNFTVFNCINNIDEFVFLKYHLINKRNDKIIFKYYIFINFFNKKYNLNKIKIKNPNCSKKIFFLILKNKNKFARDIVILNCCIYLFLSNKVKNIKRGFFFIKKKIKNNYLKNKFFNLFNKLNDNKKNNY